MNGLHVKCWQPLLFACVTGLVFVWILARLMPLMPLYVHADVRRDTERALRTVADREGWLLSDMYTKAATSSRATIIHREHGRGRDAQTCYLLDIRTSDLSPCDAPQDAPLAQ